MRREAPDIDFFREIKDFNLDFLGLLAAARGCCQGPVFGLDGAIVEQIAGMTPAQLDAMAEVPCLLAGFAPVRRQRVVRVAEPRPDDPVWMEHARLYAAGLLTYAWQMVRRDALRAALCVGAEAHALVAGASIRDMRGYANHALQHLEARFRAHSRFWPDLVRATRDGRPERMLLARLTAVQAATMEVDRAALVASHALPILASGAAGR